MTLPENEKRDSKALEPELIADPQARAEAEARNGLRQYDAGIQTIQTALERQSFKLRLSLVLALHREALAGISMYAGNFRPAGVQIQGSQHEPVGANLVPELIEEMCDYVNSHWEQSTPIHLGAYIMWRLNWIHPFADGNGRTSRILSYVVLSIRAGAVLPGTPTIPDQIVDNRTPYFEALDAADAAWRASRIDVSKMEDLLGSCWRGSWPAFMRRLAARCVSP
jgi:Fic family protein